MSRLSSPATASTTTKPTIIAITQRVCSADDMARVCMALTSEPLAAPLQAADDRDRVVDGGAQRTERRGVADGIAERTVDLGCLVADGPGQQQNRHDQRDDGQDDDDPDNPAQGPAEIARPGGCDGVLGGSNGFHVRPP